MSSEELAEQLRTLKEMVQKLQSDNEQLREEVNRRPAHVEVNPNSSPSSESAFSSITPAPVQPAPSAVRSVPPSPPMSGRYVFVPRERKCPRFSGKVSQDSLSIEEWVEEIRRSLEARPMSCAEKTLFVFDLLDGEAKAEVKFRPTGERDDADKIFDILLEAYGCSQSYITLQQQFFQRRQLEGESLREYSHSLMSLMERLKQKAPLCFPNPDSVLRDQFTEHVRDNMLKRELKRHVRRHPDSSFLDIRSEAVRWVEEGENANKLRPRAYSCSAQGTLECEADLNAVSAKSNTELSELKECLIRQQAQLDAIMQRLDQPSPLQRTLSNTQGLAPRPSRPDFSRRGSGSGARTQSFQPRFQPDGTPICMRCNQPGHLARNCPNLLPPASQGPSPAGGAAGAAAALSPSGN